MKYDQDNIKANGSETDQMALHLIQPGVKPSVRHAGTFTGDGWRDELMPRTNGITVGNVSFTPCSRTYWHSHEGGQLLIIVFGVGLVADADGALCVRPGDMVWTPPGVRHWHGASAANAMMHTTVSVGQVEWFDAVADQEYVAAESLAGVDARKDK